MWEEHGHGGGYTGQENKVKIPAVSKDDKKVATSCDIWHSPPINSSEERNGDHNDAL